MYDCYTLHSKEPNQYQIQTGLGHTPKREEQEKKNSILSVLEERRSVCHSLNVGFLKQRLR